MKGFFSAAEINTKKPPALLAECGTCGLLKQCRSPKIPVYGEGRLGILIVLAAPDTADDFAGRPYTGGASGYLANALMMHGVNVHLDCWTTYANICHNPGEMKPTQIDNCKPNMRATIERLAPTCIIPLGSGPCRSVIGDLWKGNVESVDRWAGFTCPAQRGNVWVCPTWSPAEVAAASSGRRAHPCVSLWWHRHLQQAIDIAATGRPWATVPDFAAKVQRIYDPTEAARAIRWISSQTEGLTAFDYENNCLKPDGAHAAIATASIAWGRHDVEVCIAYPWAGDAIDASWDFLRCPLPKVASNLKHEERWALRQGPFPIVNWWLDTMNMAHVLDSREGITGLKFQAFALLGQPDYDSHLKPMLEVHPPAVVNRVFQIPLPDLLLYNGLDSVLEWWVARDQALLMGWPLPKGVTGCGPCLG